MIILIINHKFSVRFWYLVNLQAKNFVQKKIAPQDYMTLNIESLVLDKDEKKYIKLWHTVFGEDESIPKEKLSKNTIFSDSIGADGCITLCIYNLNHIIIFLIHDYDYIIQRLIMENSNI